MDLGEDRAQQIRAVQARIGDIGIGSRPKSRPTLRYGEQYETAALLSSFTVDDVDLRSEAGRSLLNDSVAITQDGTVRYVLDPDVRRNVIRQLGTRERMHETLERASSIPNDEVQLAINRIVESEEILHDDERGNKWLPWLHAAYRALVWFEDVIPTQPASEARSRIIEADFLDRFESLVGENFQGRHAELQMLRDYVGVLSTGRRFLSWVFERRPTFEEAPALVVTGPGGIGKSTLLSKFILDHAAVPDDRRVPFVYLNFDSPTVRAGDPKTILVEAIRQLAVQYPEYGLTVGIQQASWSRALQELTDLSPTRRRVRSSQLDERFRIEFVSLLSSLGVAELPLLFVLDTFEVVQEKQHIDIATLLAFLRALQADHPTLRVVISGRAMFGEPGGFVGGTIRPTTDAIPTRELRLGGLDRETSAHYLEHAGLPPEHAAEIASHLVPEGAERDGTSPLSLRVAAEIWRRDTERSTLDPAFWASLRAGRIQAQLVTRYVRHLDPDSKAGRLAPASLLLRRITAAALHEVVAPAWDVPVDAAEANGLFDELARRISLVIEHAGGFLEPRPEVQGQVYELLSDLEPERVRRLHELAVEHYRKLSDQAPVGSPARDGARFDEIVHRLFGEYDESTVRKRWLPGCADYLSGRVPLLSRGAQALLDQLAGRPLTADARAAVSLDVWQIEAAEHAKLALAKDDPRDAVRIIGERDDWDRSSKLSVLLASAHVALGQLREALDVASVALASADADQSSALFIDLSQIGAEAAYRLGQPQEALTFLDDAAGVARDRNDTGRLIPALLLRLVIERERDTPTTTAVVDELLHALDRWAPTELELAERDALRLHAQLDAHPELVPMAVRLGGVRYLSADEIRSIGRIAARVDEEVSARLGNQPGTLALAAGVPIPTTVTRAWQDHLARSSDLATSALIEVLRHDVPTRDVLSSELASSLATRVPVAAAPVARSDESQRLSNSQRRALVDALVGAFDLSELEAIYMDDFDRSISSLARLDVDLETAYEELVRTAERHGLLDALIVATRNRRPESPALLRIANERDVSTIHFSLKDVERIASNRDPERLLARLGVLEGQIGRLEVDEELVGTALLVGPDVVLAPSTLLAGTRTRGLRVRFGLKSAADGRRYDDGVAFQALDDGLADQSAESDAGFTVLRLAGYPADEPLGTGWGRHGHRRREFADISTAATPKDRQTVLICAQQRVRLELRIERRAIERAGDVFLLPALGSSAAGAPCFGAGMDFLGLLLPDDTGRSRLVPARELMGSIRSRGHGGSVGMDLR